MTLLGIVLIILFVLSILITIIIKDCDRKAEQRINFLKSKIGCIFIKYRYYSITDSMHITYGSEVKLIDVIDGHVYFEKLNDISKDRKIETASGFERMYKLYLEPQTLN